jgi:hypothetical protein
MMGGVVSRSSPLWQKIEQQAAQVKPVIIPPPAAVMAPTTATLADQFSAAHKLADTYLYGPDGKRRVSRHEIIKRVCWMFDVSFSELASPSRNRRLVKARDYAIYLMCRHTIASTPEMGQSLGGRDHTTILAAIDRLVAARNVTIRGRTPDDARAAIERFRARELAKRVPPKRVLFSYLRTEVRA